MGTKLWYGFYPTAIGTDEQFMQQMDALVHGIGDRAKADRTNQLTSVAEGVPP
eukprot:COSAG05_NODE_2639_length_2813_cov_1.688651_4_plen_52_part_01